MTAYEASGKEFSVGSAATEANGEYTVKGLPEGAYKVGFSPGNENLNYITQYYEGKSSLETAQSVAVKQNAATSPVNAELEVGGEISGTVTDAATRAPLSRVDVFALGSGEAFAGEARTNASGQYTIPGLAKRLPTRSSSSSSAAAPLTSRSITTTSHPWRARIR